MKRPWLAALLNVAPAIILFLFPVGLVFSGILGYVYVGRPKRIFLALVWNTICIIILLAGAILALFLAALSGFLPAGLAAPFLAYIPYVVFLIWTGRDAWQLAEEHNAAIQSVLQSQ